MKGIAHIRRIPKSWLRARLRHVVFFAIALVMIMLLSLASNAQTRKDRKKQTKSRYKSQVIILSKACELVEKKKYKRYPGNFLSRRQPKIRPMAEVDPQTLTASIKPMPIVNNDTSHKSKVVSEKKLDDLHKKEDEVLEQNHLRIPSSDLHKKIQNQVAEEIKKNKDSSPVELQPLFFTFDEDEFAVVDMEPFLVAVEYALQGKMVLIEGHTDSKGKDDYNMKLSIKRVQKIRELMHDMGVPDERISVVGYGEGVASFDNSTEEGRQNNRRVDFKVF